MLLTLKLYRRKRCVTNVTTYVSNMLLTLTKKYLNKFILYISRCLIGSKKKMIKDLLKLSLL